MEGLAEFRQYPLILHTLCGYYETVQLFWKGIDLCNCRHVWEPSPSRVCFGRALMGVIVDVFGNQAPVEYVLCLL